MRKIRKIYILIFLLSLVYFVVLRILIFRFLPASAANTGGPFITDILGIPIKFPFWLIMTADVFNLLFLFRVGKDLRENNLGLLLPVVYALSPWPAYLSVGGSIWILILSGVLLLAYGLFLIKNNNPRIGFCITSLGIFLTVYLNLLMLPVVILILLAAFKKKIFSRSYSRSLQIFFVLILPLLIISLMHPVNVSLVMKREISLFSEVKLVNSINVFRGESEKLGFPILGKLIENKFTYFGRHVLFNFLTALSPYTYFTQQFPLLGFSFSPPVFLGFLIPSLYYLIAVVKKHKPIFDLLLIAFPLLIPTLLHSYFPDMNSLVIFLPLLLVFISRGIDLLVNDKKNLLIFIMLILVFFQASTTLYDLSTREPARYFLKTGITNEKK